jgi:hypothetical protein
VKKPTKEKSPMNQCRQIISKQKRSNSVLMQVPARMRPLEIIGEDEEDEEDQ